MPALIAGLGDVVENELHIGTLPDHFDHVGQLEVKDADVEDEIAAGQHLQPVDEVGPDTEVRIGLGLDDPPYPPQGTVTAKLFQSGFCLPPLLERQRRDHPCETRVAPGEVLNPARLLQMLRKVDIHFHKNELLDLDGCCGRDEVIR